jgi:hypothetical protein
MISPSPVIPLLPRTYFWETITTLRNGPLSSFELSTLDRIEAQLEDLKSPLSQAIEKAARGEYFRQDKDRYLAQSPVVERIRRIVDGLEGILREVDLPDWFQRNLFRIAPVADARERMSRGFPHEATSRRPPSDPGGPLSPLHSLRDSLLTLRESPLQERQEFGHLLYEALSFANLPPSPTH